MIKVNSFIMLLSINQQKELPRLKTPADNLTADNNAGHRGGLTGLLLENFPNSIRWQDVKTVFLLKLKLLNTADDRIGKRKILANLSLLRKLV